jgi:hypothetical protein
VLLLLGFELTQLLCMASDHGWLIGPIREELLGKSSTEQSGTRRSSSLQTIEQLNLKCIPNDRGQKAGLGSPRLLGLVSG